MSDRSNERLEELSHIGPICSLTVFRDQLLLSGEGPTLNAYNYKTNEKCFGKKIFNRNKIHGISCSSTTEKNPLLSIWGGRSLCISRLDQIKNDATAIKLKELSVADWIMYTEFSNDFKKLYVLTAHNVVVIIDTASLKVIDTKSCGEKSILYSGSIRVLEDKVIICAGTVMDGIIIWELESERTLHSLVDHEGSIFGLKASDCGKYLLSCSDDRSIRVWDLDSGSLLATGWGHGSRIWSLNFFDLDGTDSKTFKVFSSSEDCTARIWQFTENDSCLKQLKIFESHMGRNVWSSAVDTELKLGFTGGADGRIKIHDLSEETRPGYKNLKWTLPEISAQADVTFIKDEIIKEYFDFGSGLLSITSTGKILLLNYSTTTWNILFEDSRYVHFSLVKGFELEKIVVISNKDGDLIFMKFDDDCNMIKKAEHKEDSLVRLNNVLTCEKNGRYLLLLESPKADDKLVLKEFDAELHLVSTLYLTKPKDKIVATALDFDDINNYIIIGSRFATVTLYDISQSSEPLKVWRKFVKGDTISHIKVLESGEDKDKLTVLLTFRDRDYFVITIDKTYKLELIQDNKIQKGFIEGGFFDKNSNDLILYGFKSDSFFVWNETRQFEIMREICGGPHRQWSFTHKLDDSQNLKCRFIYTRSSGIQLVENGERINKEYLASGLHGREIRSMAVTDSSNPNEKLLITGSEDTTIILSTLTSSGEVKPHWSQRHHGSGMQSVHFVNKIFLLSSSAKEELYLWKLTQDNTNNYITLFRTVKPSNSNPDLRIMDFDTIEIKEGDKVVGFLLIAVYSDSNMKAWYFSYEKNTFKLLMDGTYRTCCILNVKFVKFLDNIYAMIGSTNGYLTIYDITKHILKYFKIIDDEFMQLIADDESFEIAQFDNLVVDQQLHQSSIKSFDIRFTSSTAVSIVTGGDDNALILSSVQLIEDQQSSNLEVSVNAFDSNAASSTITSVKFIDDSRVLVTSVDQIVRLWSIDNEELSLLKDEYTTVADTGCAAIADFGNGEKLALVGGSGFSTFSI
ncbi:hypothetical protein CANARDRAFT_26382 [[Candida] arabinofermentans NRRL YB-2248]|uniref:Uncharacterized protein n=1 Tax=[Candida] arabinofermentans NRRL YB-2248 TaxID=983967 RepID=A0A1E4T993_9ASCO|nr:hypothetical protein CANARDRAFT_26382 [[Candida] arabinofermentans NRRL YB-2248]